MKTKRILSLALASALAMSMSVPAFAAGEEDEGDETAAVNMATEITGTYTEQPIAVVVPETGAAFINPYALDINISEDADNPVALKGMQIATAPLTITNNSAMDLSISADITVKANGAFKFATASTKGTPDLPDTNANYVAPKTDTSGYVVFQMKATNLTADSEDAAINAVFKNWAADDADSAKNQVVLSATKAASGKDLIVARKADGDGNAQNGSIVAFRLAGDCVETPKTAWAAADGFTANIAFTFKPATWTAPAGS